jgi:hypothetical protein
VSMVAVAFKAFAGYFKTDQSETSGRTSVTGSNGTKTALG